MRYLKTYEKIIKETELGVKSALLNYSRKKESLSLIRELVFLAKNKYSGRPLEYTDSNGRTPLLIAALYGFLSAVQLLIENGSNIKVVDKGGNNLFILLVNSSKFGDSLKKCIDFLMTKDIDISHKNYKGEDAFRIGRSDTYSYRGKKMKEYLEEKYPEKWEEYLLKKEAEQYNL